MEFLAIIIVLVAVQLWGNGGVIQKDHWLDGFRARLQGISNFRVRLLLFLGLPVLVALLVEGLLTGVLWGLPLLLFFIAVLLYSLGRGDFSAALAKYYDDWSRGDLEGAYRQAQALDSFDHDAAIDNAQELHETVREAIFYEGFERWFAVVFWFVLLGPAAALLYRLGCIASRREDTSNEEQAWLDTFIYYADWLPARLLVFTFALIGNFDRCISACRDHVWDVVPTATLLDSCGHLALADPLPENTGDKQFVDLAQRELQSAQRLLSRSLLCWVAVLAVVQLI